VQELSHDRVASRSPNDCDLSSSNNNYERTTDFSSNNGDESRKSVGEFLKGWRQEGGYSIAWLVACRLLGRGSSTKRIYM